MSLPEFKSRLFARRNFADLKLVLSEGLSHGEISTQVSTWGIPGIPEYPPATKAERVHSILDYTLKIGWPDGDEAILGMLTEANISYSSSFTGDKFHSARGRIWSLLEKASDRVQHDGDGWRISDSPSGDGVATEADNSGGAFTAPSVVGAKPDVEGSAAGWRDVPIAHPVGLGPSNVAVGARNTASVEAPAPMNTPTPYVDSDLPAVFVVHGRNRDAAHRVRHFLRGVHLRVLDWDQVREMCGLNPMTWDIVRKGLEVAHIIVVVFSGDDLARLDPRYLKDEDGADDREETPQPRQNVTLEAGMALGLAPDRTVLVRTGRLREISDLAGFNWVTMNGSTEARAVFTVELKKALTAAGVKEPLKYAPPMWNEEALGPFSA
ncbi:nucleotide-binding protein [Micrococcus antarcticus]|uniref:TIR domain-containing protein n=1 Tax=Micrococcus antarcticus TaxID=86171 RepID=UPI0038504A50